MRESIGGISLFQIVIVFLLLFTAVMCFTINHSRAFAVKDEVVSIIENSNLQSQYLTDDTLQDIFDRLSEVGYRTFGSCPNDDDNPWTGYTRIGRAINQTNSHALFCIRQVDVPKQFRKDIQNQCPNCTVLSENDFPYMYYYNVMLFYQLDVPVINRMNFNIVSSTKVVFTKKSSKDPGCHYGIGGNC